MARSSRGRRLFRSMGGRRVVPSRAGSQHGDLRPVRACDRGLDLDAAALARTDRRGACAAERRVGGTAHQHDVGDLPRSRDRCVLRRIPRQQDHTLPRTSCRRRSLHSDDPRVDRTALAQPARPGAGRVTAQSGCSGRAGGVRHLRRGLGDRHGVARVRHSARGRHRTPQVGNPLRTSRSGAASGAGPRPDRPRRPRCARSLARDHRLPGARCGRRCGQQAGGRHRIGEGHRGGWGAKP